MKLAFNKTKIKVIIGIIRPHKIEDNDTYFFILSVIKNISMPIIVSNQFVDKIIAAYDDTAYPP